MLKYTYFQKKKLLNSLKIDYQNLIDAQDTLKSRRSTSRDILTVTPRKNILSTSIVSSNASISYQSENYQVLVKKYEDLQALYDQVHANIDQEVYITSQTLQHTYDRLKLQLYHDKKTRITSESTLNYTKQLLKDHYIRVTLSNAHRTIATDLGVKGIRGEMRTRTGHR